MVNVGDHVLFIDEKRQVRHALVNHVFNQDYINIVMVSDDANKDDSFGRQTEHETSVFRKNSSNEQAGRYFDEVK